MDTLPQNSSVSALRHLADVSYMWELFLFFTQLCLNVYLLLLKLTAELGGHMFCTAAVIQSSRSDLITQL